MTRLIVDTDTAGDDVFSLLIAPARTRVPAWRRSPSAAATSRFEQEVENALYTVEIAGRRRRDSRLRRLRRSR